MAARSVRTPTTGTEASPGAASARAAPAPAPAALTGLAHLARSGSNATIARAVLARDEAEHRTQGSEPRSPNGETAADRDKKAASKQPATIPGAILGTVIGGVAPGVDKTLKVDKKLLDESFKKRLSFGIPLIPPFVAVTIAGEIGGGAKVDGSASLNLKRSPMPLVSPFSTIDELSGNATLKAKAHVTGGISGGVGINAWIAEASARVGVDLKAEGEGEIKVKAEGKRFGRDPDKNDGEPWSGRIEYDGKLKGDVTGAASAYLYWRVLMKDGRVGNLKLGKWSIGWFDAGIKGWVDLASGKHDEKFTLKGDLGKRPPAQAYERKIVLPPKGPDQRGDFPTASPDEPPDDRGRDREQPAVALS